MKDFQDVNVYFQRDNLTLQIGIDGRKEYEINLEQCNTSAQALDWIYQVLNKPWCTPEVIYKVLEELNNACEKVFQENIQGTFCPFGQSQEVDWRNP